jgi:hypothetical protein
MDKLGVHSDASAIHNSYLPSEQTFRQCGKVLVEGTLLMIRMRVKTQLVCARSSSYRIHALAADAESCHVSCHSRKTACEMPVGLDRVGNRRVHDLLKLEGHFLTIVFDHDVDLSGRTAHQERVVYLPFRKSFSFGLSQ